MTRESFECPEHILANERIIRWAVDPRKLPYLRESVVVSPRRKGRPSFKPSDLLVIAGWSEVSKAIWNAPGLFERRCWWLKTYDWKPGGPPAEAVDARSIRVGERSQSARSAPQRPAGEIPEPSADCG